MRTQSTRLLGILLLGAALPLTAQETPEAWVRQCMAERGSRDRFCEVREYTLPASGGPLRIDGRPNGGITVTAWDQNRVRVLAKVQATTRERGEAEDLVQDILVITSGREVRTEGPRSRPGRGWSVIYEVWAPVNTPLNLTVTNGGVLVEGIHGEFDVRAVNGGVVLRDVSGPIRARTTNGGVEIALADGAAGDIEARATNGGIRLRVPAGFSAMLDASATNGGVGVDLPIRLTEHSRRVLRGQIGEGGPTVKLTTTNGGVEVRGR